MRLGCIKRVFFIFGVCVVGYSGVELVCRMEKDVDMEDEFFCYYDIIYIGVIVYM